MPESRPRSNTRNTRRSAAEERARQRLYRRAADAAIAAEVVHHLESDTEAKQCHLALYLQCRETLRRHKARKARNERIGTSIRRVAGALVLGPLTVLRRLLTATGAVALELLPAVREEPARARIKRLATSGALSDAAQAPDRNDSEKTQAA